VVVTEKNKERKAGYMARSSFKFTLSARTQHTYDITSWPRKLRKGMSFVRELCCVCIIVVVCEQGVSAHSENLVE
jgi:hypothetical protein